uniref:Ribosomal protein S14 n=1 Tax=Rhabditophanes sp. KR3021 TaxID=114890 RepID=A0AC35TG67_9BILA
MIRNLSTLFKLTLDLRPSMMVPNISRGVSSDVPPAPGSNTPILTDSGGPEIELSAPAEEAEAVAVQKCLKLYNQANLSDMKLDTYPFYVEREWWKEGKRMTFWANWRQLRDVRRRNAVHEAGPERLRLKALKENTVLPQALRDEMGEKLHVMNSHTRPNLILNMCMFTGRQRGKIKPYRVNRHIFRKLADHSQLSGVQRAMW